MMEGATSFLAGSGVKKLMVVWLWCAPVPRGGRCRGTTYCQLCGEIRVGVCEIGHGTVQIESRSAINKKDKR